MIHTLNLSNSPKKNILLRLLILEILEHVVNDRLGKVRLLALLLLLLVAYPAIEDGLDLSRERNLLLLDERLRLELGRLLRWNIMGK